jgi:microcin C transport system permease protein
VAAYLLRRLLLMIPTLLGISLVVFTLVQIVPGGPVEQAIRRMRGGTGGGETGSGGGGVQVGLTPAAVADLKKFYGFDKPLPVRYVVWLGKVVRLDLGTSYQYRKPVWELIKARIPISLAIAGTGFLLAYLVCVPLGVYKAVHHRTWKDAITSVVVFLGFAIPEFALGMLLLVLFGGGSFWDFIPLSGITSDTFSSMGPADKVKDVLHHLAGPLLCYMIGSFAAITIITKNSLLEVLGADYVRTALAKGLPFRRVLYKHALRNALIPLATGFGQVLSVLVASSLLIEVVFGIHGMGMLSYEAITQRDYPVTLGLILVGAGLSLLGNLVSDVLYVLIDPRISFSASGT